MAAVNKGSEYDFKDTDSKEDYKLPFIFSHFVDGAVQAETWKYHDGLPIVDPLSSWSSATISGLHNNIQAIAFVPY